jgi:N-acetyl sugar amidotransferase
MRFPTPKPVNLANFAPDINEPIIKYGLPESIGFCKNCVMSNQRPNSAIEFKNDINTPKKTIKFDENGVCDACRVTEEKNNSVDWEAREKALRELCDRHRSQDGAYDCILPGSGGKDSFVTAHKLKYEYGMHPLTVTWAPHIYTDWGWRNMQRWIHSGFDNILFTPNGRVHRLLTRIALESLYHPFQPFILGQKNIAARFATKYGIPLVFYGEDEAEYGNPRGDTKSATRDASYFAADNRSGMKISGIGIDELKQNFGINDGDLEPYLPVDLTEFNALGGEVHYLGYYLKWHPQGCYYYAKEHGDFEPSPERTPGTYSKYNGIDDKVDDFHFYTTCIKFGIGRATYDAAQEIRSGDIERDEGLALVRRYDGEFPERFADEVFQYLSISRKEFGDVTDQFGQPEIDRDYFMRLTDTFRSPHLWLMQDGQWRLRNAVWHS